MVIAGLITLYFFRQNILGIHESSGKALKIMIATTVMAVVMLAWCGVTLAVRGPVNRVPLAPDLRPKVEYASERIPDRVTGEMTGDVAAGSRRPADSSKRPSPTATAACAPCRRSTRPPASRKTRWGRSPGLSPGLAEKLRQPGSWWSIIGVIGVLIAFGHSILAMSGEETLAQVYREVESPKLRNFKKAAFIIFVYSLVLTAGISFLAVLLIPDEIRMKAYADNLIGGLAMHVIGPPLVRLLLNAFVVVVGFLILAGAVNTAIIGSNGVLNRVAEDGVLPNWFLKPHPPLRHHAPAALADRHPATDYDRGQPRRHVRAGRGVRLRRRVEFRLQGAGDGGAAIQGSQPARVQGAAEHPRPRRRSADRPDSRVSRAAWPRPCLNFLTKEVASVAGTAFTAVFLTTFMLSERYHEKKRGSEAHRHLEQFNRRTADEFDPSLLGLNKPYRKLVAIRSSQNLYMLEKAILETDPETTDVVVMTAKVMQPGNMAINQDDFDHYDRELMTAVVNRAETIGKEVKALIMPTNNPLFAVINTAKLLGAQELILGASNKFTADEQLEQLAFYWMNVDEGQDDAADDSRAQPAARRLSRSGRRQSHPENQRTQGPLGRRAALGRHRRQPRHAGSLRHGREQRPVQGRADDARSRTSP